MAWPTSGVVPGADITIPLPGGRIMWVGTLQVLGASSRGQSGIEWLIFASQPAPLYNSGGSSYTPAILPPVQMVDWAQVFIGRGYTNAGATSGYYQAYIASGGLPDARSGGKDSVSGIVVGGALGGPAIGLQWMVQGVSDASANTQINRVGVNASAFVSGQNVGVWLIGR